MCRGCLDTGDGGAEVVERATASGAGDILGLGGAKAGSLQYAE